MDIEELVKECKRQEESCAYTAAGLYEWQKRASKWRTGFIITPIILSGAASIIAIGDPNDFLKLISTALVILSGFFPAIYVSLGMDMRVREITTSAVEFTNLRDRFRQLANLGKDSEVETVTATFEQLMDRMDSARTNSPPLPTKFFSIAQRDIRKGNYSFRVDEVNKR
ncbi:SLATT domain-containing protein [Palleronia pelagia]|uniref:SLATT domain-containing protein n=1 Tax=Palleronia pelagia TaxID=387096 RepID=UPI00111398C1|nr:SLATT domain-containing protein [Palleronia pelagia]